MNEPIVATALIGAIKEVFLHHLVIAAERAPSREDSAESLLDFGLRGLLHAAVRCPSVEEGIPGKIAVLAA